MKPRERVLCCLQHKEPDRVPVCVGVSNATGIKMGTYQKIRRLSGLADADETNDRSFIYSAPWLGTADPDEEFMTRVLRSDVRGVFDQDEASARARYTAGIRPHVDSWGSNAFTVHPLRDAQTPSDILGYKGWPDALEPTRMEGVRSRASALRDAGEFAVMGTPWLLFPLERAFSMMGMEAFLECLAARPETAAALLRKNLECCEAIMERFLAECGDCLDMVKIGDDLGTQNSLLMSPRMYRALVKPVHAEFISFIKRRTNAKVFFHSCGDVFPLIDDLIEVGVDVLNPVQSSSGKMGDLSKVKDKTRGRLVLCGGIDTHRVLNTGTPNEVDDEVRRVVRALAPGGGYMLASVHTIMDDVPPQNVVAMADAALAHGKYPIAC